MATEEQIPKFKTILQGKCYCDDTDEFVFMGFLEAIEKQSNISTASTFNSYMHDFDKTMFDWSETKPREIYWSLVLEFESEEDYKNLERQSFRVVEFMESFEDAVKDKYGEYWGLVPHVPRQTRMHICPDPKARKDKLDELPVDLSVPKYEIVHQNKRKECDF